MNKDKYLECICDLTKKEDLPLDMLDYNFYYGRLSGIETCICKDDELSPKEEKELLKLCEKKRREGLGKVSFL